MRLTLFLCLTICLFACSNVSSPTATVESVSILEETITPSTTSTPAPTSSPSATITPSVTPSPSSTPTVSPTPSATHTPTPTPHPLAELPYRIVFSSDREDGNGDIFTMKADGSDWIRLTDSSDFDFTPQVSPDGQKIAFASDRDGTLQIYMMNVDGSEVTRLTDNVGNDRDPSWSPDSNKIVFASDRNGDPDIFVIGSDGSGEEQLTDNGAMDVSPVWSPDGQWIVFSSSEEEEDPNLYLISPDGSNLRRITFSSNYDGDQASWSPDGQFLVFPSLRIGNYELYLMSLDGSAFGTLTRTERDEYSGLLSPDGRYLLINVYSSDFIGLVIRDLVTEEEFQLTDSSSRASYASWIPNGTVNYDPALLLSAGKTDENCVYADDETYGYTADNPIPNGNGPQFGGPFDGLFVFNIVRVAPAESQTSLRQHTFPSNDRGDYLDTYLFTSSGGTSVVLYANINDYEIPKIPVGLFCDLALP